MKRVAIKKITICGFGLIGGCIALDLLKGKHKFNIYAYDRPRVLKKLKETLSFKIKIEPSLKKAIHNSDIIILSAPHKVNESLLVRLSKVADLKDCLIIDTGAVKSPIANLAQSLKFADGTQFLPTHPMAGKEKSGFENAASNLFYNHAWYLDEDVKLNYHNQIKLNWMIKKMKAMPVYISVALHDEMMSELSHLPQLISTILGAQINPQL
ncbi:MAG: prephenate dehydrogenase/arogenate dehydrogenase family protein, partial [FCB group bacterium]|nr:prephenate dehydrogenase/arogenate dehydrogenase family protein [FCB group bacterium]